MAAEKHPLHSMCSYLGCFPPLVPRRIIERWFPKRAVVLDPFCGAGTTLLEAMTLGRGSVGVDLNPLAVAISAAKITRVPHDEVLDRLLYLAGEFPGTWDTESVPPGVRQLYHPRTLAQILFLREALREDCPEDLFLRGVLLGILHGKVRKDGTTAYLSIDMPNTFSMSPDYVRGFVAKHKLQQPLVDVFSKLRERVEWLSRDGPVPSTPPSTVLRGDATQLATVLERGGISRIDGIVASPPYLGVLRYGAFNWIRLWFLGFEPAAVDRALDGTDSLDRYLSFFASFLMSAAQVCPPRSTVALVVGDVVEYGRHVPLAERVWEELAGLVPFDLTGLEVDEFDSTVKTTRIWGEERKGRATPMDRILILRRRGARPRTQPPPIPMTRVIPGTPSDYI